jgi:hypothetical protein
MRAVLVTLPPSSPSRRRGQASPTLFGTVGPGFQIELADGLCFPSTSRSRLVHDQSWTGRHNFHITGRGGQGDRNRADRDARTGHPVPDGPTATSAIGDFTVGSATLPPTTTTSTPPPPPSATRLAASVGPGKRIAVTRAGAKVRVVTLKRGAAVLVVRDLSATDNFHLTGPGVNRTTTKAGKGTFTWKLALKAGLYRYRSDATATLKGSFRVTA